MKKLTLPFVIILLSATSVFAQNSKVIKDYIEKYKDIAIEEMLRTGVPASIKLAQGIHETSAGQSVLVLKSNNHFGIKCKAEWKGPSVSHDDDAKGECFRKYEDPFQSYKDHSDFLKTRAHYASLFKLNPTDYEGWAYGLKKAGYATNPKYPQIIIKLIKDYNLHDYTLIALGKKPAEQKEIFASNTDKKNNEVIQAAVVKEEVKKKAIRTYPSGVFKINETNVVFITEGTSFLAVAQQYNVPLARIFDFNDLSQQETAAKDQLIYLQRKRKVGANEIHTVAEGETLHDIAQVQGIRIESLLSYNFLKPHMLPQVGENLYLRKQAPAMPRLATADSNQNETAFNNSAITDQLSINNNSDNDYIVHVVQPKETMYAISKKYDVALDDVLRWNELTGSDLKTGQQLRINKKTVNATN